MQIEVNSAEAEWLLNSINESVKAQGLQGAGMGLTLATRIQQAAQAAQQPADTPAPAEEVKEDGEGDG